MFSNLTKLMLCDLMFLQVKFLKLHLQNRHYKLLMLLARACAMIFPSKLNI